MCSHEGFSITLERMGSFDAKHGGNHLAIKGWMRGNPAQLAVKPPSSTRLGDLESEKSARFRYDGVEWRPVEV